MISKRHGEFQRGSFLSLCSVRLDKLILGVDKLMFFTSSTNFAVDIFQNGLDKSEDGVDIFPKKEPVNMF